MNCSYCGYFNEHETELCARCGTKMPQPTCNSCDQHVEWGSINCGQCRTTEELTEVTPCPSCNAVNHESADYCTKCGTPMAVITRVLTLARSKDQNLLDTWRVYGIETKIVGRERELEILDLAFEDVVSQNEVQFVALTAPSGRGKSRLLSEFQDRLNKRLSAAHFAIATSRDEAGDPYSMFARLLKDRFYIEESAGPSQARRKLLDATKYLVGGEDGVRVAHLVGELLDIHFKDSPYLPTIRDPDGAHELDRRCFEALASLLEADASKDPLVVVLEDLQYANQRSLALISYMKEHLRDSRILFILTWSNEELKTDYFVAETTFHSTIELDRLSDEDIESFVIDTLRKTKSVPDEVISRIVDSAHGNPYTVEETLRMLISQGIVDTRTKEWTIDLARFSEVDLPQTIETAINARLHTLNADERLVLEMAACIGNVFWAELVRCLYRMRLDDKSVSRQWSQEESEDERCNALLESLERKDMIRRRKDSMISGTNELYFKHRLERKIVYSAISDSEKQKAHQLTAQWLELKFPQNAERIIDVIASHFDRAGAVEQAAAKYLEAAKFAAERYQNKTAIEFYVKSLSYLSDADIDRKITAFGAVGELHVSQGEYDQGLTYFREMLRYCWLLNDTNRGGYAYIKLANAYQNVGEYELAMNNLANALDLFHESDEKQGIAETLDQIGRIHMLRGSFENASDRYEASLQLRRELGDKQSLATSLNNLGGLRLQQGDLKAAMGHFREALEYRKEIDDRYGVVSSYNNLAVLCIERNQIEQALHLLREALTITREIGYRGLQSIVLNNIGEIYLISGEIEQAHTYLNEAAQIAEVSGEKRVLFDVYRNLGRAALKEAKFDIALERGNEALSVANQLDSELRVAVGIGNLADVRAQMFLAQKTEGCDVLADELYKDAIGILSSIGHDAETGRLLLNYARLEFQRKKYDSTLTKLKRAEEIFERMELQDELDTTLGLIEKVGNIEK